MNIHGHEATRIHGTVQVELEDGGLALLEVDIDVTGPASMGVSPEYADRVGRGNFRLPVPIANTLWVTIPRPDIGRLGDGAMFRLRVPTT